MVERFFPVPINRTGKATALHTKALKPLHREHMRRSEWIVVDKDVTVAPASPPVGWPFHGSAGVPAG